MVEKTTILTYFTASESESYTVEKTSNLKDLKSENAEEEKDNISAEQEAITETNIHIQLEGNSETEEQKIDKVTKTVSQKSDSKDSTLEKIEMITQKSDSKEEIEMVTQKSESENSTLEKIELAKEEIGGQSKSEEKKIERTAIVNLYNRKIASQPKCNNTQTKSKAISSSFDDSLIQSEETSTVAPLMQSKV